jgi:hypothetical protein
MRSDYLRQPTIREPYNTQPRQSQSVHQMACRHGRHEALRRPADLPARGPQCGCQHSLQLRVRDRFGGWVEHASRLHRPRAQNKNTFAHPTGRLARSPLSQPPRFLDHHGPQRVIADTPGPHFSAPTPSPSNPAAYSLGARIQGKNDAIPAASRALFMQRTARRLKVSTAIPGVGILYNLPHCGEPKCAQRAETHRLPSLAHALRAIIQRP